MERGEVKVECTMQMYTAEPVVFTVDEENGWDVKTSYSVQNMMQQVKTSSILYGRLLSQNSKQLRNMLISLLVIGSVSTGLATLASILGPFNLQWAVFSLNIAILCLKQDNF